MFKNHAFQGIDPKSAKSAGLVTSASLGSPRRLREAIYAMVAIAALMLAVAPFALAADAPLTLSGVVNINTASSEELQLLPGVGEKRAEAIIDIRKSKGGFETVDELVAVKGLGEAMLERMRPHVTLKGETTAHRL